MSIKEIVQNLIGSPEVYEVVTLINGEVTSEEIVKILDLEYIASAILLIMTVYCMYNILLNVVKNIGGK